MQVTKVTKSGAKSQLTVSDAVFGAPVNKALLAQAVRVYLSNQRQGTSKTQTRSDVNRTSAKWYKQKGTGRARHGARNAPEFVGGGVAHGPNGMQNWTRSLTKILKGKALVSALSAQVTKVMVSDAIGDLNGKTKEAVAVLKHVATAGDKVLIIVDEFKPEVIRSLRNIERVVVTRASRVNALEIAMADTIVMTGDAITALEKRLGVASKPVAKKPVATQKAAPKKVAAKPVAKKPVAKKPTVKKTTKKVTK